MSFLHSTDCEAVQIKNEELELLFLAEILVFLNFFLNLEKQ